MRPTSYLPLFLTIILAAGCEDTSGMRMDPLITNDTLEVAAPTSGTLLPTAIDVTATGGRIGGGRFPEKQSDAERWDIAVRMRGGALVFVPSSALGLGTASGITEALAGRTFESVREAPGSASFITDGEVVIQEGAVYVVRSRSIPCGFGATSLYAKIQPLEVSVEDGRVRLQISTNEVCGDPRLVPTD